MHACKHLSLSLYMYIYIQPERGLGGQKGGCALEKGGVHRHTGAHIVYIIYICIHACMHANISLSLSLSLSLYVYTSSPSEAWAVRRAGARWRRACVCCRVHRHTSAHIVYIIYICIHACMHANISLSLSMYIYPARARPVQSGGRVRVGEGRVCVAEYTDTQAHTSYI